MLQSEKITFLDTVDSTNSFLRGKNLPDHSIVYSFNQTAGRGRESRKWSEVKDKNLALSVYFSADKKEVPLWRIALLSLPLVELLKSLSINDVWIKWPNDIFVGKKKIAGVLAESVIDEGMISGIIAGIGVNVNLTNEELSVIEKPATSVFIETGQPFDIFKFSENYIQLLSRTINEDFSVKNIRDQWLSASGIIGKSFEWISSDGPISGLAVDVDENGYLYLDTEKGLAKIVAGDVNVKDSRVL